MSHPKSSFPRTREPSVFFPNATGSPLSRGRRSFAQAVADFGNPERRFVDAATLEKKAPRGAFSRHERRPRYGSALMACASRVLFRDAVFLCTTFLSAMRSITDCCALNSLVAAALSPPAMAFLTFFSAVRSDDLRLALC